MLLSAILLPIVALGWLYDHLPPVLAVIAAASIVIWGLNLDWKGKAARAVKSRTSERSGHL